MSRPRKQKGRPVSGWLVLDKPTATGSTACVSKIKWLYRAAKAGHAGTLDPLASGMLPIALGDATKTVPYVMDGNKTYRFTIRWGAETTTDDLEGHIVGTSDRRPAPADLEAALMHFRGEIEQVPPAFSAIKVEGERAYDLARDGQAVDLAPRRVMVHRLGIVAAVSDDETEFETECGKGTYVRAIARDLGRQLGCYGHVSRLRRTAVGPFREEDMIALDVLTAREGDLEALDSFLLPASAALATLPEIVVTPPQANRIVAGNSLILRSNQTCAESADAFATLGGELLAIGAVEQGAFHPRRVFPGAMRAGRNFSRADATLP
jgi:tRNA pseudouridine55 synthase